MAELKIYSEREMRQAKYEARKQAEQFYEGRLNQFKAAMHESFAALTDLDIHQPTNGIFVPYDLCKRIVAKLRQANPHSHLANWLKHWMNKSDYEMLLRWERVVMKDEEVEKNPAPGPKARGQD
jgi:hypothetical protein